MKYLSKINSIEKKLAVTALLLAAFALIAGPPINSIEYPDWDIKVANIEGLEVKLISVSTLANWLKEKRNDFVLVDLRAKEKFDLYHIPEAVSIDENQLASLNGKSLIIFYSEDESFPDDIRESLNKKYKSEVYLLDGGMEMWKEIILFPDLTRMIVNDDKQIKKILKTSRYFGGQSKLPQNLQPKSSKKYLREGC